MNWQPEQDAQLKALWATGLSAGQIAAEMACGLTRNAIIGRIHRLGLSGRARAGGMARPKLMARSHADAARDRAATRRINRARKAPVAPPIELPADDFRPQHDAHVECWMTWRHAVPFLDRGFDRCAWPMWPDRESIGLVCGAPRDPEHPAYCARHRAKACSLPGRVQSDEERHKRRLGALRRQSQEQARAFGGR